MGIVFIMVMLSDSQSLTGDSSLASQITQALRGYDAAGFGDVSVLSHHGVVTLVGTVPSWYSRSLAYQLATRQPQVSRVLDFLNVKQSVTAVVSN